MEQEFQDPPEVKSDDRQNGLLCFLDDTRECGPDCMGYTTVAVENSPLLGQQQRNCILLISAERLGRYVGAAATMMKKAQDKASKDAADKKREDLLKPDPQRAGLK